MTDFNIKELIKFLIEYKAREAREWIMEVLKYKSYYK